jgi:glutaredoxin
MRADAGALAGLSGAPSFSSKSFRMRSLLLTIVVMCIASVASAQIYRWVDQEGKVHYSQTPPPPGAKNIQKKAFSGGDAVDTTNLPYATQLASKNFPVTLRTSPDCGAPCNQARAALVRRGVPFREVSVVTQEDLDELKKLSGKSQLPHLVVGGQRQSGFHEDLYTELLDTAGYPSSGPQLPLEKLRKMAPPSEPARAGTQPGGDSKAPQDTAGEK